MFPHASIQLHSSIATSSWNTRPVSARCILRCAHLHSPAILYLDGMEVRRWEDPLASLSRLPQMQMAPTQRWVGYISYDAGNWFETLPASATDDIGWPVFCFALVECAEAGAIANQNPIEVASSPLACMTKSEYLAKIQRVLQYIRSGDVFQVNLSHRISAPLRRAPEQIWAALLKNPALYGAYLDLGDHTLISHSPELFLHVTSEPGGKRRVRTCPIKGTRPAITGMHDELLNSAKDQAELNMIIDLVRNDLGRVCEIGSVRVTEPRRVEPHPTLFHGVASIEGTLRAEVDLVDLLRATFPGGSVTGCPKIRAMQIIDELEPTRRGPYCGVMGYIDPDGTMMFNLAIRTLLIRRGMMYLNVGGGIVADSEPEREWEETWVKAQASLTAAGY